MTTHEAQQQLISQLNTIYDNREAANIADWVMEYLTGWKKIDRIIHKQEALPADCVSQLDQYTAALLTHKPVQYVLHEAWFAGCRFYVDENVLIPRPETEELVEWIVGSMANGQWSMENFSILDIGTGSGCIPITLKKKLPQANVFACDISEGALTVAQKNATDLKAAVQFIQADFLNPATWAQLPAVNILVSNPPYIPLHNKLTMHANVLEHEPHLALFVPNEDPLLFYKALADFAQQKLLPGGVIFCEIHEDLGDITKALFIEKGFTEVEVKKDMQGKDRMVKAVSGL